MIVSSDTIVYLTQTEPVKVVAGSVTPKCESVYQEEAHHLKP